MIRGSEEISIGLHPRLAGSIIHPVMRVRGKVVKEPFYTHVCYRECDIQRELKVKIFKRFLMEYSVKIEKVGRGEIFSYSMTEFYKLTVQLFKENIYIWLKEIPKVKPYRK